MSSRIRVHQSRSLEAQPSLQSCCKFTFRQSSARMLFRKKKEVERHQKLPCSAKCTTWMKGYKKSTTEREKRGWRSQKLEGTTIYSALRNGNIKDWNSFQSHPSGHWVSFFTVELIFSDGHADSQHAVTASLVPRPSCCSHVGPSMFHRSSSLFHLSLLGCTWTWHCYTPTHCFPCHRTVVRT